MRLHLAAFPHTRVEPGFSTCAYTAKVLKLCKMLGDRHELFVYAPAGDPVPGAELVPVLEEPTSVAGPGELPAWPDAEGWAAFNEAAARAINERSQPRDLVLCFGGCSQQPLVEQLAGDVLVCEPGVGYEGIFSDFCAFESYAWMHWVYGQRGIGDGRWYDDVVPNYFDLDDFAVGEKEDYLLYLGRLISRKGVTTAAAIARELGRTLVVAGPGALDFHTESGKIWTADGVIQGPVEYVGVVGPAERKQLLAGAACLLAPTTYIEPFGGVAVEAMLSGTPAVTTDWGAFTETVVEGGTGYRFRTLPEGCRAVERALELDPEAVAAAAAERYSLEAVAPQMETWLTRLGSLWSTNWDGTPVPRPPIYTTA